jgi:DNA-binding transcriptional ArsR family regulator
MSDSSLAPVFEALGHPVRLSLVARLRRGGRQSLGQLAVGRSISRQAVTKHLATLEAVGLVRGTRYGRETVFEFDPRPLGPARDYLDEVADQWEKKLGDLKDFLGE